MIRTIFASTALLSLAACATPATNDGVPPKSHSGTSEAADSYLALGTEPGWTLEITPGQLNYTGDYGDVRFAVANPGARTTFNGHLYEGERLRVDITHTPCNDGMSDRRYADTVRLTVDGTSSLTGCGGDILPPADLSGTRWIMLSIGGRDVAPGIETSLMFDGQRMTGNAGCNRFTGPYTSDGTRLTTGPIAATRMACPGPAGEQEAAALQILGNPASIRFARDGNMILMGTNGKSIVLQQVI